MEPLEELWRVKRSWLLAQGSQRNSARERIDFLEKNCTPYLGTSEVLVELISS
jgi:hypothetical protein